MPDFTSGPWTWMDIGDSSGGVCRADEVHICTDRAVFLAHDGSFNDEDLVLAFNGNVLPKPADARLIEAAPELYSALRECLEPLLAHNFGPHNMSAPSWEWYKRARAALDKADGGEGRG